LRLEGDRLVRLVTWSPLTHVDSISAVLFQSC
jgi:hypothetical protein